LLYLIFIPVCGSFLLPVAGVLSARLRNILALAFVASSFIFSLTLIPHVYSGATVSVYKRLAFGFNLYFTADSLAVFMACVSSLISSIIVLYSFGYISHYRNQNEYYFMVVMFLGAMMGLVFSSNLIILYVFWEITGITSWRLIGYFRKKEQILKADKAFLVTVFGAVAMLLAIIMVYQQTGTFDLPELRGFTLSNLAVILILTGIFSKSATLPFHTWLPDAGVAPSPVTALLHAAVLVKIGVYVFARFFLATFNLEQLWQTVIPVIAGISVVVSAGAALVETDLKRIIAYSTVSQIGFIFLGFCSGNALGIAGSLLYILMHGLAKAGLFLCAGIVEQNTKNKDITKLGGLITTMPVTAIAFLLCSFSVMGIPPFGGFFSKYLVFNGAIQAGQFFISGVFLVGAFMTVIYLFRVFNLVFLGEERMPHIKEGDKVMVFSVALLALFSLLGGVFINYPASFAQNAAGQLLGCIK
jgi:proton-translocating NADH-quinone oxidoreductase chain N